MARQISIQYSTFEYDALSAVLQTILMGTFKEVTDQARYAQDKSLISKLQRRS